MAAMPLHVRDVVLSSQALSTSVMQLPKKIIKMIVSKYPLCGA
jgi:hypothetical protein